jgi:hypothetical protein
MLTGFFGTIGSCFGGFLVWLLVRRPLQQMDSLRRDLESLKQDEIREIKASADKAEAEAKSERRRDNDRIARIERESIHKLECQHNHDGLERKLEGLINKLDQVAAISQKAESAMKTSDMLLNRMINLKGDIESLHGRLEAQKK